MTIYVSLGSFCLTSSILKDLNLKTQSYPFDWVFADPSTVEYCINNDFKDFLNHDYLIESQTTHQCNHSLFFKSKNNIFFFQHHNPRQIEDYMYFTRCIERFRQLNNIDTQYIMTLDFHIYEDNKSKISAIKNSLKTNNILLILLSRTTEKKTETLNDNILVYYHISRCTGISFEDSSEYDKLKDIVKNHILI